MSFLFDTNVIIYYFNGLTADESIHDRLRESFRISIVTEIEFLGWGDFISQPVLYEQAKYFMSQAMVYPLDHPIAEATIRLRQQYKTKTPDAIIAATALVHGLTVITQNTDDFTRLGVPTLTITMKP
ncbi:type II toxin-antitoxin system VapC family toxin [Acidithiobacillus sp. AMEEHan]|uniref:type II toxin-antitoxin system VapC family toxin n=1 Tax=Acidithiobacillus sp. AMEEHan TaxID=2994951 RepID=UPI0027E428C7|nr:type II toxin-antitoxin system VapC family toxin [Acidithiobacillus sp. AMEEHan]